MNLCLVNFIPFKKYLHSKDDKCYSFTKFCVCLH